MRTVNLSNKELYQSVNASFLPLGFKEFNKELFEKKIQRNLFEPIPGVWGTLGWANNGEFDVKGSISFSMDGNLKSIGATGHIVDEIKVFNPRIDTEHKLVERFINFDKVTFNLPEKFALDELPKLQLTLYLQPDEGAIVFYQHNLKSEENEFIEDEDADIEFILPEKTDDDHSSNRDRLNYYFDVIPSKVVEIKDHSNSELLLGEAFIDSSFVVKILTFKRDLKSPDQLLKEATSKINKSELSKDEHTVEFNKFAGDKKYALLKLNPSVNTYDPDKKKRSKKTLGGKFESIDKNPLERGAKTLLLLHGTFSTTYGTFKKLIERKGRSHDQPSFLQTLINDGIYDQIIAFDHPTITQDVFENTEKLLNEFLGATYFGSNKVDVIACSRGCILAECIAGHPEAKGKLEFRKIMLFSSANGVAYFTAGKYISKFLSVLKKTTPGPMGKILLVLTQFSADYFLKLPGCQQMTPGSERLRKVLSLQQNDPNTLFKCAVSDWKVSASRGSVFKRGGALLLDRGIALILGKEHDWVVGCTSQRTTPIGAKRDKDLELISMHTKYLDIGYTSVDVHAKIREYLEV